MNIDILQQILPDINSRKDELINIVNYYQDIIILGNGGSNAIASHIAEDYTKQLKRKAISFSDPARLTCYINDYGMENAYVQFLYEFATVDTLVILISSSGNSMNIVNSAIYCSTRQIPFITLSGFKRTNRLNQQQGSLMNYWVDSEDYGIVEISHLILLHSIL